MSVEVSGWEIQLPPIIQAELIQQTKEGAENKSPLEEREGERKGRGSIIHPQTQSAVARSEKEG